MLTRWKKTDILIALLLLLTVLSYFLFPPLVFKLMLWAFILVSLIRLMVYVRQKLLWQIRNRLIFSALFLVATPILFITFFFYLISSVVITQYGGIIIGNMMTDRVNKLETISAYYLKYNDSQLMLKEVEGFEKINMMPFITVFWEKKGATFQPFFKFPKNINTAKLIMGEYSGYFLVDEKLYLGALNKTETLAVLVAYEINQQFLDALSVISDFKIIYKRPAPYYAKMAVTHSIHPKNAMSTSRLTGKTSTIITEAANTQTIDNATPLAVFTYSFFDFNTIIDNQPLKRDGDFVLSMDFGKIYKKIVSTISSPAHHTTRQLVLSFSFLFVTLIFISFLIGVRMVRVITRAVNQLTKGTQRIRNGDFSFRIKTRSGDQLQYLAESFNEMASGIDRLLIDEKEKQRLEEELRIARSIQLKLLPPDSFQTPEFELAAVNIPAAEIAGDYFDYFYQKDAYLSILVADVSGKGASAAFYMAELKGVINHLQREVMSPAALIAECHHSLKSSFDRVTFITMNEAQFKIPEKKFVLARAGHTPALFYSAKENKCSELFPQGMAIGLINFSESKIKEIEMDYFPGDILFLFSDGLSEIMNEDEEMLGITNLKRILCDNHRLGVEVIKQKILDFSIKFSESTINRDDLTFIILKVL